MKSFKEQLDEAALKIVNDALKVCKNNKRATAKLLGVDRKTVYNILKKKPK